MPAATINEIDDATTSGPNNVAYSAGWTPQTSTTHFETNATTHTSSTVNATATVTMSGRCLYLIASTASAANSFSVMVDGVALPGVYSTYAVQIAGLTLVRQLTPLVRGLSDGAHTVVITLLTGSLIIDGFLIITGAKGTPVAGNVTVLGDSYVVGTGATTANIGGWAYILCRTMAALLRRPVTPIIKGSSGESLFGSGQAGAQYRCVADFIGQQPEFGAILYGANDISNAVCIPDWIRNLTSMLTLIEDCLDTSQGTFAFGGPPLKGPELQNLTEQESTLQATRHVLTKFPWCRYVDVYETQDGRNDIYDWTTTGLHPNDQGHALIAMVFARVLAGLAG